MKELIQEPSLLTIDQVAQRLGICRRTMLREIQRGRFTPPLKIGKAARWSREDVDAYFDLLNSERQPEQQRIFQQVVDANAGSTEKRARQLAQRSENKAKRDFEQALQRQKQQQELAAKLEQGRIDSTRLKEDRRRQSQPLALRLEEFKRRKREGEMSMGAEPVSLP